LEIKGDKIMLAKDTMIKVTNRDNGTVGYSIPELHVTRLFQRDEVKEISMDELRKLSYIPGGQVIINECLIIHNEQALKELNPDYEPEYFYTEEDVKRLLLTGAQEEFLDCLDCAPEGVLNLVKTLAVDLEINDLAKREAIFKKTGFNVTKAVEINRQSQEEEEVETVKQRRAAAPTTTVTEPKATGRRTTPKYSVKA
jgi:hypothetical protein